MLLLYPKSILAYLIHHSIYIPLCFYFILNAQGASTLSGSNLHSTMLLLYLYAQHFHAVRISNLHSTMLLLYRQDDTIFRPGSLIYIPLCFYFIPKLIVVQRPRIENLHSTMLLLYRIQHCLMPKRIFNLHSTMLLLYLALSPFTVAPDGDLHSTMLLLYPAVPNIFSVLIDHIYIPLCFYFIFSRRSA